MRQPKSPNSSVSATSFTIGAAIRNENVTPSGTPAWTKPMNSGTAEHEQNGVTTPRLAAMTLATPSVRPASSTLVRSGVKAEFTMPMTNTIPVSRSRTLGVSKRKNCSAPPRWLSRSTGRTATSASDAGARSQ